eukprot:1609111-Rhodomonas_salina.3
MEEPTISAQFVPGVRLLVFDFGGCQIDSVINGNDPVRERGSFSLGCVPHSLSGTERTTCFCTSQLIPVIQSVDRTARQPGTSNTHTLGLVLHGHTRARCTTLYQHSRYWVLPTTEIGCFGTERGMWGTEIAMVLQRWRCSVLT